ncbi:MAG: RNA pseudouridine synthase, partial [Flavobacteriales bacterium]
MTREDVHTPDYFQRFNTPWTHISLPEKFDFPFYYEPHEIALIAAKELQQYLLHQQDWEHDFGTPGGRGDIIGKMFGVLVVRNAQNEIGYLCAVSGKLAGHNEHKVFVPPVFDILQEDGFFRKGESMISEINERILQLENAPERLLALQHWNEAIASSQQEIDACKTSNASRKASRRLQREQCMLQFEGAKLEAELKRINHESTS